MEGEVFKTSQINAAEYEEFFTEQAKKGLPIIHISLCEGLSNSINNAREAARNLAEKGIKVSVIDATIASAGSYILALEGVKYRDEDMEYEEAVDKLSRKAKHIQTFYTTDTLKYFARGGRLSKSAALLGGMLHVNIILGCNAVGKLRVKAKVIGQKKAFKSYVQYVKSVAVNPENEEVYVVDAQNKEDAKELAALVQNEVGFKSVNYLSMGPTIGAHTGPGLIAMFFFGKEKTDFE